MIGPLLEDKREELGRICERYDVKRLDLFGSALGKDLDPDNSDVDFVVAFAPWSPARLFDRYFGLKEELEMLLGHRVDLVMEGPSSETPTLPGASTRGALPCMRPEVRTPGIPKYSIIPPGMSVAYTNRCAKR